METYPGYTPRNPRLYLFARDDLVPPPAEEEKKHLLAEIGGRIAGDLRPRTCLVVGHGTEGLVEVLREKGVDAWKIDIDESMKRPCDLVLCLEVLGQLPAEQAERMVNNICQVSQNVLFSYSPFAPQESAGSIYRTLEYWVELFARFGFVRDFDVDVSFVAPWAIYLRKVHQPLERVLSVFESRLRHLEQEIQARRKLEGEQRNELSQKGFENQALYFEKTREIQARDETIRDLRRQLSDKEYMLQDVLNSRSWQFMRKIQAIRLRLIPHDSLGEKWMFALFRGLRIWRREGLIALIRRASDKISQRLKIGFIRLRHAWRISNRMIQVKGVHPPAPLHVHRASVDIIVCVHNALEDVRRCLDSVILHTSLPYTLILVDDGSESATQEYVEGFNKSHGAILLRNDQATGYTRAANQGLRQSTGDFVILLNSDTVVTPGWVDRLVECAESDERIGLVGPLSNTASWQSIPEFEQQGDWASNPLPEGISVEMMGGYVAEYSSRSYPDLPFLNGFCLFFRRTVIDEIGYFDEENFGAGYGEENDYCLRARKAGWRLSLADDVYIYHAQSRSYSNERRKALSDRAAVLLAQKHGQKIIDEGVAACIQDRVLMGIRGRSKVMFARQNWIKKGGEKFSGKRLLFVLPIPVPGGGGNVIINEARAMLQMGVDVRLLNLKGHQEAFEQAYPEMDIPVVYCEIDELPHHLIGYDAVVATFNPSVAWMTPAAKGKNPPVFGYYIQDFEPYFYQEDREGYQRAVESYSLIPDMVRFAKTEWTQREIQQQLGLSCSVVGGSFDVDLIRPRPRRDPSWPDRPLRIAAMVRPYSPHRSPKVTMEVLKQASRHYGSGIEIILFGTQSDDPGFMALPRDFDWSLAGVLSQTQIAALLNEVDIFVDFSTYQAMGLTAMEAMACGNAVIVPARGGAATFAKDGRNSLVVDTSAPASRWRALQRLVEEHDFRIGLQRNALLDMCEFYPERPAFKILSVLFPPKSGTP